MTGISAPAPGPETVPMSPTQALIWLGQRLEPDAPIYNMAYRFRIEGRLDPTLFSRAFAALAERHDCLRTVVVPGEGEARLAVGADPAGRVSTLRMGSRADADAWIEARARRRFDLDRETFEAALIDPGDGSSLWFLNQHHIVTDAASGEILYRDFSVLYAALEAGTPPVLDAPVAPAAVAAGRAPVETPAAQPVPPLPKLYAPSRPAGDPGPMARMHRVALGPGREARLAALLESDGFAALSPAQARFNFFATLLAAWIGRVSRYERAAFGVVTHGRPNLAARRAAGCFVELFPFEVPLEAGESFRDLHARVAEAGFEFLRNAQPGTSSADGHRRFNVVLNMIRADFPEFAGRDCAVEWLDNGATEPRHALRLNVMDFGPGRPLELGFLFKEDYFDRDLQVRAASHALRLLDAFLADPDQSVEETPLADDADCATALTRAALEPRPVDDIVGAFLARAREAPGAVAIDAPGSTRTRKELLARAEAVAEALDAAGHRPGAMVGIHLTRSADLPAALFGVLLHGSTFVPLDPAQPPQRLDTIADLARLDTIITEAPLARPWPGDVPALSLDAVNEAPSAPYSARPGDAPAYAIFTSGTTGLPKGVLVGRAALSRYAHWAADSFAGSRPLTWALHSAIGFDLTITSIFAPLAFGGTVRVYPEDGSPTDLAVLRVFEDDAVDVVKLTPAHLSLVLAAGRGVARIAHLVLGGEDLSTALARRAVQRLGRQVRIFNEYGPTECTVGCMIHRFAPDADTAASVPIGRPARDTAVYVLDKAMNPVPDEVVGELYVGGPERLADGYFGNPEETRRRFLPNPFRPGERVYRTGDLASVRRDGTILYHGREDEQLSIRGVRIETEEIRQAALSHPDVTAAAIVLAPAPDIEGGVTLCARCGIGSDHPEAHIDASGICALCRDYETFRDRAQAYFSDLETLGGLVRQAADRRKGDYDLLVLLSGGKDSTYSLCRLAEMTPRILAVTLDNGFIAEGAKANIVRVTRELGVDHRFISTPAMNAIFVDSLKRHANVCNGCFKAIYTLGLAEARKEGIATIVTGLSRGQMFETRLAPELFGPDGADATEIDALVLAARKSYHRTPDLAAERLNGTLFDDDSVFDEIAFVDFYRYCDVSVSEIYRYLDENVGWLRPLDTGRSTNCLINDVGILYHKRRRGYHNYALPYSWDVRMGHKTRDEARHELEDEIDEARVRAILDGIGYPAEEALQTDRGAERYLSCYVVAPGDLDPAELKRHMLSKLPRDLVPQRFMALPRLPLTPNGKVDVAALPPITDLQTPPDAGPKTRPRTPAERAMRDLWAEALGRPGLGVTDNFYDLGGDSITAIKIAARAAKRGFGITAADIFRLQTVAGVAAAMTPVESKPEPAPRSAPVRAKIDDKSRAKLARLFGKPPQ